MHKHHVFQKIDFFIIAILSLVISSCSGGNGGFKDLIGGDLSDVDELTIISTTPSGDNVTVQVGQQQAFTILAEAPPPSSVSYYFTLDGSNVVSSNAYTITGTNPLIGNHTVTAHATDGTTTKSKSWTVKVNGAPTITSNYESPNPKPKVAVGYDLNLTVTGTDPNGDALTYEWRINGSASAHLVATDNTAVLTADPSILPGGMAQEININVTATDTSNVSTTYTFQVEVNAFDQSCNTLSQYDMCTYVGIPTLGDGYNPIDPDTSSTIKLGPIALTTDSRNGNLIIADWSHNLVWYWNKTASAVDFLQFEGADPDTPAIPANTIKVIAGTGEGATEAGDLSLAVGVNGPRGLYYDAATDRLFISEWNASRVKIIASNGLTAYGLGAGSGHTDGANAAAHACANPAGMSYYSGNLYVACRGSHRVKAWNLTTNFVNTVYGATTGTSANFRNDRSAMTFVGAAYAGSTEDTQVYAACAANCGYTNPYDVHVDASGFYVTHDVHNYVRYCNTTLAPKTMFGVTIGVGFCRSILGTGAASYGAMPANPRTTAFNNPNGILADNGRIIVTTTGDRIVLLNATGGNIAVGDYGIAINNNEFNAISSTTAGYTEGAGAVSRQYNDPYDIIIDPDSATRSYIITDYNNRRIRRADYGSNLTTSLVGSGRLRDDNIGDTGLANAFYMNRPSGLVYDNQSSVNSLFVMDANNDRVLRVDQFGNITTVVGGGGNAPTAINGSQSPTSISLNTDVVTFTGITLFQDFSMVINNAVHSHLQLWNRSGAARAYLNTVTTGNNRVNQLGGNFNMPDNAVLANYDDDATSPMLVSLANPSGVAVSENTDGTKEVFVSDEYRHCIRRVYESSPGVFGMDTVVGQCKNGSRPNNTFPGQAEGGGGMADDTNLASAHTLYRPVGLIPHYPSNSDITDAGGTVGSYNGTANLIIADYNNNTIRYWNRSGTSVQFAGINISNGNVDRISCNAGASNPSENIFASGAQCNNPVSFAMSTEHLCFSQGGKHNVRCIYLTGANEGKIFTLAGSLQNNNIGVSGVPYNYDNEGRPATEQRLNFPTGLVFDPSGDLYISDQNNHLIKKVKMTP